MYHVQFDPLPNGVMRIYAPMPGHRRASVTVGFRSGSVDDPAEKEGRSHLLEHCRLHAAGEFDSWRALARQWDRCCYDTNAETDKATTLLYAQTIDHYLSEAIEIFGPVVLNPRLETRYVETEKERVLEERREYLDQPDDVVDGRLDEIMFPGWRISHSVIGSESTIRALTVDDLQTLHRQQATGARMVIGVAGGFHPDTIAPQLERLFGQLPSGVRPSREVIALENLHGRFDVQERETEHVHFVLGFPAFDFNDPDAHILGAIRNYLSVRTSSRLRELIDGVGKLYTLCDFLWCWDTIGQINWRGSTSRQKFGSVAQTIARECFRLCQELITPEDLLLVKRSMEIRAVYRFDDPSECANFMVSEYLNRGSCVLMPEYLQRIQAITPEDVRRVARRVFVPERLSMVAMGPLRHLTASRLRKMLFL